MYFGLGDPHSPFALECTEGRGETPWGWSLAVMGAKCRLIANVIAAQPSRRQEKLITQSNAACSQPWIVSRASRSSLVPCSLSPFPEASNHLVGGAAVLFEVLGAAAPVPGCKLTHPHHLHHRHLFANQTWFAVA